MLKKNLVRSAFVCYGLLFLIPATIVKAETSNTVIKSASPLFFNYNDTLKATAVDSAMHTTSLAPKIQLNKNVSKFVTGFLKKEDEFLQKMRQRSQTHFDLIENIFSKYGLPEELKYLAIVESELRFNAVSRVGAKGMWQFMPVTARELGLKVSGKYDERTNIYKSTTAAAKYLKSLYAEFGDWLLVLAAYNSGPGTVLKAMKKSGSKNFWALQSFLPQESRGHVKRFIGIHYFFEQKGSIATQTKAESLAYKKALAVHIAEVTEMQNVKDSSTFVAMNEVVK